jgi:uncharacterized membrane protein YjgN (DUF898 family)
MENLQENRKIEIGQESLGYLNTTRKWTMFFAILGFIFLGLMLIIGLLAGSFLTAFTSKMSGAEGVEGIKLAGGFTSVLMFIILLVCAVIYFFPSLYLLRFSTHTAKAVANLDQNEMQKAFKNLKLYWVYLGILVIIMLVIYLIVFIVAGASLAFLSGLKG